MTTPPPFDEPQASAEIDRPAALKSLQARINLANTKILEEFTRVNKYGLSLRLEENSALSRMCLNVLLVAKGLFPSYRDFRRMANSCPEIVNTLVPQALVNEGGSRSLYTEIFEWVAQGLRASEDVFSSNCQIEVIHLQKLIERDSRNYSGFIDRADMFPKFHDGAKFRDPDFYKLVYGSRIEDQAGIILRAAQANPGDEFWAKELAGLRVSHPGISTDLEGRISKLIQRFVYDGTETLRKHIFKTEIPLGHECEKRMWDFLGEFTDGNACQMEWIDGQISIISKNQAFWPRKAKAIILIATQEVGTYNDHRSVTDHVSNTLLSQLAYVHDQVGLTFEEIVDVGLQGILSFDPDILLGSTAEEKARLLIHHRWGDDPKPWEPNTLHTDAFLHLIFRKAPASVMAEIASINDQGALAAYAMTSDRQHLKQVKDHRNMERVFSTDLGL